MPGGLELLTGLGNDDVGRDMILVARRSAKAGRLPGTFWIRVDRTRRSERLRHRYDAMPSPWMASKGMLAMTVSRRHFLVASLGLVATGCKSGQPITSATPSVVWPDAQPRPRPTGEVSTHATHVVDPPAPAPRPLASNTIDVGPLNAISRTRWARGNPIRSRLNAIGRITRLTIHHEGHINPVYFSDFATTADRMERIRKAHLRRRFGDIGYHVVIDRKGRLWEGRNLRYQGAHVRDENEHNFGIMVLGNFDKQVPTRAQYDRLLETIRSTIAHYDLGHRRVFTHRELGRTNCPGRHLQDRIVRWRRLRAFA